MVEVVAPEGAVALGEGGVGVFCGGGGKFGCVVSMKLYSIVSGGGKYVPDGVNRILDGVNEDSDVGDVDSDLEL